MKKPTMLMILDGFGLSKKDEGNAIAAAKKPNIDRIFRQYPMTTLSASGTDVGLPPGQMGNSEVGHLNIGGGRIVYQDLLLISNSIKDGSFFSNDVLKKGIEHAVKNDSALHIHGLVSDGGVHSHMDHIFALIDMAKKNDVKKLFVHCYTDGRDTPPESGINYIRQLEDYMKNTGLGTIGVVSGRYYAMDRDKRWDRLEKAYDALTLGEGLHAPTASDAVLSSYERGDTDEFILPTVVDPDCRVKDSDSVIMFNFRPDRAREITRAFVDEDFCGFQRKKTVKNINYVCMTLYDADIKDVSVAFPPKEIKNTLGEYISSLGMRQLRIAETEKYAHVTFFFNGGVEAPVKDEERILIPSPKVATYNMKPEMSAFEVTDEVIRQIGSGKFDFIVLNYANADMVGHTGDFDAAVKAIEALDECVGKVTDKVLASGGQVLLTADHGNADTMIGPDGEPMTAHSVNPVPLVNISSAPRGLSSGGRLCDIAPTILELMDIKRPAEMTGRSLLE